MSLEFIARNGIISRGNIIVTGSLTASGSLALTNIGSSVFSGSITQIASTASFGGLVGIGTTTPTYRLDIVSTATFLGNNGGQIGFKQADGSYGVIGIQGGGWGALGLWGPGRFTTSTTPDLRIFGSNGAISIANSNNLLVGANPSNTARVSIQGSGTTSSTTSFLVQNSAGSTNAQIYDDGQWFIGTGNIRVTGQPGNFKFDTAAGNIANIGHYGINFQPLFYNTSVSISNIITISGSVYASGSQNINGDLTVSGSLSVVGTGSFTTPNGTITIQDRTDGINGTAPTISSTSTMRLGTTSTTLWVAGSTVLIGNSGNQLGITGDTITPNYDNSGALGTTAKYWGNAYINQLLVRTSARITGSLAISGSASTSSAALTVYKSGSTVLDVQGSQGSLMSIEDSLTGSLMSVGNISGLPLMEVFDDGTMNAGKFNVYPIRIVATGSQAIITGSLTGSFSGNIIATTFTASSALVTGNVTVLGTASINNLIINQIGYSSGSNQLGDAADDTQTFYGTVVIPTGSLTVSGSTRITGSLTQVGSSSFSGGSAFSGGTYSFVAAGAGDGGLRIDTTINGYTSLNWLSNTVGLGLMSGGGLFAKVSNNAGFHIGQSQNNTFVAALSVTGHGTTTSPTFVARNSAGTNILRVVDSGLVGINTAAPSASLHISGASSAVLLEIDSPTTNNILFVSGSGNVGIGTNTPARTLEVFKSGLVDGSVDGIRITTSHLSANAQAALEFNHPISGILSKVATDVGSGGGSPSMYFYHNGSNRITITSGGNVLIGTSTNSARLVVKGSGTTSSSTALLIQNANASSSLQVRDDRSTLFANSSGVFNSSEAGTYFDSDGTLRIQRSINGTTYGLRVWNGAGWAGHNAIEALSYQFPIYGVQGSNGAESASPLSGGAAVHGKGGVGVYGRGVTPSGDIGSIGVMATTLYVKSDGDTTNYNRSAAAHIIGRTIINGNTEITGSFTVTTGSLIEFQVNQTGVKIGNATTDSHNITGSLAISASAGTGSALSVYKSGSTVVDIQGSQGQLFSVIDTLSGSLMSVNDISGLPILEVFSDDRVVMGTYGAPALIITGSNAVFSGSVIVDGALLDTVRSGSLATGSTLIYTVNTGSYQAGFFEYYVNSGSNFRAGNILSVFGAGTYKFTDVATPDIGNTSNLQFSMSMAGASAQLYASASTAGWTVKTTFRTI